MVVVLIKHLGGSTVTGDLVFMKKVLEAGEAMLALGLRGPAGAEAPAIPAVPASRACVAVLG